MILRLRKKQKERSQAEKAAQASADAANTPAFKALRSTQEPISLRVLPEAGCRTRRHDARSSLWTMARVLSRRADTPPHDRPRRGDRCCDREGRGDDPIDRGRDRRTPRRRQGQGHLDDRLDGSGGRGRRRGSGGRVDRRRREARAGLRVGRRRSRVARVASRSPQSCRRGEPQRVALAAFVDASLPASRLRRRWWWCGVLAGVRSGPKRRPIYVGSTARCG